MADHAVVSREEWIAARKELLEKEKQLTRLRDELSRSRRALPWVKVETPYVFEGPDGNETLADLFAGRSQLIIHHFMFSPEWQEGCVGCSFHSGMTKATSDELPGVSVFTRDEAGDIFHTYSSFGRGDEGVLSTYVYLDFTPKGRNETGPHHNLMDWVRHHDRYDHGGFVDATGLYRSPKPSDEARR